MIIHVREKRTGKDAILRVRDAVLSIEARWLKPERVGAVTFPSRADAVADAEKRLHKWLARGRFELLDRNDDDTWLNRMHRGERVARRIKAETNPATGVVGEADASWGAPHPEESLTWTEQALGFLLPPAVRNLLRTGVFGAWAKVSRAGNSMSTSIQVGNVVTYRFEDGWLRGLLDERLPPLRAQVAYRGPVMHVGRLPVIGGKDDAQGAFLLPDGGVLLVEHGLEVGRLAGVEAFAEHALNVFEEACDSALSWVQG